MKQNVIVFFHKMVSQLRGTNGIILSLYIFFCVSAQIFISWPGELSIFFWLMEFVLISVTCFICPFILNKIAFIKIELQENSLTQKEKILWISSFFTVSLCVLFCWYLAYYPGSFMNDTIDQYGQALRGTYNDWHPALQTLFTFTIPLRITGRADSIILFQIIEYSVVLTYMAYTILQFGKKKYAICSFLYILLNPITGEMMLNPWKDTAFAMSTLLLMVFGLRIYLTEGEWINRKMSRNVFILILTLATLFRHNAILFTIPFLVVTLIHIYNKETCLKILMQFIVLLMLIKDPIYYTLNVAEADNRQIEMLGLPMSMLGNVAKESPESFDRITADFMFSVAPEEDWKNMYQCGSFNSIKWGENTNWSVIEETGAANILSMTFKTLFRAPVASLKGLFCLTDLVYAFDGNINWEIGRGIVQNDFGLESHEVVGRSMIGTYAYVVKNSIFKYIFCYVGGINLAIIASVLCKYNLKDKDNWKKISFCLPILIYNFGTMLLLSGEDFRFFYLSFPIFPILFLILYDEKSET